MMQEKRVPLAWTSRWRRIRLHAIPIVCFTLAVATCGWLWQRQGAAIHSIGEIDALRIDITSPAAGLVVALPHQAHGQWNLYDHVLADDVIAMIDDRPLQSEKNLVGHEVKQLIAKLDLWQTASSGQFAADAGAAVSAAVEQEHSRLAALERSIDAMSGSMTAEDFAPQPNSPELPEIVPAASRSELEALRETRYVLELRWQGLKQRLDMLAIRAPITGTLVAVYCWPGQTVHQGGRIATIAADHGRHIVSYMPEGSPVVPYPGMQVTLRSRLDRTHQVASEIEEVGQQIERVPTHYLGDPSLRQWGLPVRIKMPSDATLRPGALVDVVFHTAS